MKLLRAKREYTKPAMQVYELRTIMPRILAGSTGVQDYNTNGYYEE
jgi:hypothetical protein